MSGRLLRVLRRGIAFVFLFAVMLMGLIAVLLNTEFGSRFVLQRVASAVPGSLYIDGVSGTLWQTLHLHVLRYRNDTLDVSSADIALTLDWPAALTGSLELSAFHATEIVYRSLKPASPDPQPLELELPPLPFTLRIDDGRVDSLSLPARTGERVIRAIAVTHGALGGSRITADSASATIAAIEFEAGPLAIELAGAVPVAAAIRWQQPEHGWSGEGTVSGSLADLAVEHRLTRPAEVRSTGVIHLLHRMEPDFDLANRWQQVLLGTVALRDGDVSFRGTLQSYQVDGHVTVSEDRIPDLTVAGQASGDASGARSDGLRLQSAAGNATAAGFVAWSPAFSTDLTLQLEDVQPSLLDERLSGQVGGSLRLVSAGPDAWTAADTDLSGTLNDNHFAAVGTLARTVGEFRCSSCVVTLGPNRIAGDGSFGADGIALQLDVEAPELRSVWRDLGGSLSFRGRVQGAMATPTISGSATASSLQYRNWSLQSLRVDSGGSGVNAVNLTFAVTGLRSDDISLGDVRGNLSGAADDLAATLDWNFVDRLQVSADAAVARTDTGYAGSLTRAIVDSPHAGHWTLDGPAIFRSDGLGIDVDSHRWLAADGRVEVTGVHYAPDEMTITAALRDWPMATLNAWLPPEYRLAGSADADIDVSRRLNEWLGSVHWRQLDSTLHVELPGEDPFDLRIPETAVEVQFADGGARAESMVRIDPGISIRGQLALQRLERDPSIDARLQIDGEDWSWISSVVPAIDNFGGDIAANLAASGPLSTPALTGQMSWRNGRVDVPALNITLTEVNITANGAPNGTATVSGTARSGGGSVEVDGRVANLLRANRSIRVTLSGNAAEVINWPEYRLWATPALTVDGSADGWVARGDLAVPKAEIEVRELPENAVAPSADVHTTGADPGTETLPTRYSGQANVHIGKEFHIAAFGLDTHMEGDLVVRKRPDQDLTAEGTVRLLDGHFEAYGQRLTIEEGTLTFTGPLDDPIVDVRAVRHIEDFESTVVAGIHLRGRAKNLSSTVYAEPSMSEADALSYLVIGRPLSEATSSEGGQLSTAAVGLGIRQASRIAQQIGQSFGLDQLSIVGDGGDATALVAGKQINRRLYARYAYGVFSQLGMIVIRYKLTNRLSLEAGAGENQSIDILYTVDKE